VHDRAQVQALVALPMAPTRRTPFPPLADKITLSASRARIRSHWPHLLFRKRRHPHKRQAQRTEPLRDGYTLRGRVRQRGLLCKPSVIAILGDSGRLPPVHEGISSTHW